MNRSLVLSVVLLVLAAGSAGLAGPPLHTYEVTLHDPEAARANATVTFTGYVERVLADPEQGPRVVIGDHDGAGSTLRLVVDDRVWATTDTTWGGNFRVSVRFPHAGAFTVHAEYEAADGTRTRSAIRNVTVTPEPSTPPAVPRVIPDAPVNLTGAPGTREDVITIAWEPPADAATSVHASYRVWTWSPTEDAWRFHARVQEEHYDHRNLPPGDHTYAVSFVNESGESPRSEPVTVRTAPPPPSDALDMEILGFRLCRSNGACWNVRNGEEVPASEAPHDAYVRLYARVTNEGEPVNGTFIQGTVTFDQSYCRYGPEGDCTLRMSGTDAVRFLTNETGEITDSSGPWHRSDYGGRCTRYDIRVVLEHGDVSDSATAWFSAC